MKIVSANVTGSFILNGVDLTTTVESSSIWSGSIASRVSNLEQFSSSLDSTYATDVQLNAVTQSVNTLSSSFLSYTSSTDDKIAQLYSSTASINNATASLYTATASLNTATASLYTATASLYAATASLNSYTSSNTMNIANLFATSASLNAAVADIRNTTASLFAATASIYNTTSSLNAYTASATLRINALDQYTASLNTRSASFACVTATNNFACTQYFSNTSNAVGFSSTGSLYSDGGMRITKDMYVSGTAFFNNVTVFGTQSVAYISSSQLNIGTNIISVNTDTPSVRFGGLAVFDSGSTGLTGSMLWDSQDNQWIYSNPSGSEYDSAVFLVGPRNSGVLGNEPGISCNFLSKGNGLHHMTSSGIFEDGSRTCFYGNTVVSSSGTVCTTMANASCIGINTTTPFKRLTINASGVASDGIAVSGDSSPAYIICETSGVGSTFTNDSAAGYIGTHTNHPFNVRSNNQNRLTFSSAGIACFACTTCAPTLIAGSGGIRTSNNIIFPGNLTTRTIWNEGYGGAVQLRRSDADTDRYARIGIVDAVGNWVSGMTIDGGTAFGKFDAGICIAGGACLAKVLVNAVTDDAASALQIKVLSANATSARIASTTNNNLFSFISNAAAGHSILDMGRCTESGTFAAGYIRLRTDGDSWIQGGNVGIGTASPTAKLQINSTSAGAATVAAFLVNESVTANTEVRLAFAANTNNDITTNRYSYISAINTSSSNGQALTFATNETGNSAVERMRITSAGVTCFSSTVCAPGIIVGTSQENIILSSSRIHLNTCVQRFYTINHWQLANGSANQCTVVDGAATYGCAKVANINASSTYFYGPYSYLTPGSYVAKFRMKVDNNSCRSTLFYLDTNRGSGMNVSANTFCTSGCYQYINIPFTISSPGDVFEARALDYRSGITCTYLDHVLIEAAENPGQYFSKDNFSLYTGHFNCARLNIDTNGNTIFNCNGTYCSNFGYNFLTACNGSILSGTHTMGNMGAGTSFATPYWCDGGALRMEFNWSTGGYVQWINHNNCTPFLLQWSTNYTTKHCFDYTGGACHSGIVTATGYQGAAFSTLSAGGGTGVGSFDTITRSGVGLYEVAIYANPNAGGSDYVDFWYGHLIIGRGFSGVVSDFITWCQESPPPRCLYPSGGGGMTVTACMYYSGAEYSCISRDGSYTIRFKISGYNSSYTGANTTVYLKSIA